MAPSPPSPPSLAAPLDQELALAALASERLRIDITLATFGMALAGLLGHGIAAHGSGLLQGAQRADALAASVIAALLLYELFVRALVVRRAAARRPLGRAFWLFNTAVEVSVASVVLLSVRDAFATPLYALSSPAFLVYYALLILATLRLDLLLCLATGALAAAQYLLLASYLLSITPAEAAVEPIHRSMGLYALSATALLISGLGAGWVAREIGRRTRGLVRSMEERSRLLRLFGQFTSAELVNEIMESGIEITSKKQRICFMFFDIRGFTTFAESHEAEVVVDYINRVYDIAIEQISRHHGMVHQLRGDGFLAFFGAPLPREDDCQNAYGSELLVSREVMDRIQLPDRHQAIDIGEVDVRGRRGRVHLFQLRGRAVDGPGATARPQR